MGLLHARGAGSPRPLCGGSAVGLRRRRPLRAVRRLSAVLLGSPCASSSSSEERRRVPLPRHFPGWPWPTAWAGVAGPPAPWGQVGGTPAATLWALPPWRSRPGGARGRQPGQPPVPRPSFVAFPAGRRAAPGGTRPAPPPRCPAARSGALCPLQPCRVRACSRGRFSPVHGHCCCRGTFY